MKNAPFPYYTIDEFDTFEKLLQLSREKYGSRTAFRTRHRKQETCFSFDRLYTDTARLAAYCSRTYGSGNRIAILGENSYLWIISFFAIVCSGNIAVPIDKELSAGEIARLLEDCGCHLLFHSAQYADVAGEIPACRAVSMQRLEAAIPDTETGCFAETPPDDTAVIIYTSGTTGKSKGVMLSQKNFCEDVRAASSALIIYGRSLAVLPFHHSFAFTVSVLCDIYHGVDTLICHSLKNVTGLIADFKPTLLTLVPMIVEQMDKAILREIENSGKKNLLRILDRVCRPFDALGLNLRRHCFRAVRKGLGGALDFIICGGASLDQAIIDRFAVYDVQILNGYGITECSPVVSVNRRYHHRAHSVGQPLPGVQVRIHAPDSSGRGEICVRSDIVMRGYYGMPVQTEAALRDGWFHTGDLGFLDKDGFIHITGRLKNLIVLSSGKNVSPEELESLIVQIPGVSEAMVYEENRMITAELYPDPEFMPPGAEREAQLRAAIARLNDTLPPYKAIASVKLRDEPFEKTTSRKIRRTRQAAHKEEETSSA